MRLYLRSNHYVPLPHNKPCSSFPSLQPWRAMEYIHPPWKTTDVSANGVGGGGRERQPLAAEEVDTRFTKCAAASRWPSQDETPLSHFPIAWQKGRRSVSTKRHAATHDTTQPSSLETDENSTPKGAAMRVYFSRCKHTHVP